MPTTRKQRKEEDIVQSTEDFDDANQTKVSKRKSMVANVNKSRSKGKTSAKTEDVLQISVTKRKAARKEAYGVTNKAKRSAGLDVSANLMPQTQAQGHAPRSKAVEVNFDEDGQDFHMTVDVDEDCYGQSEEESDREVSFRQSGQSAAPSSSDESGQESDSESISNDDLDPSNESEKLPLSREERIKQLDEEMKTKIKELHDLVVEGGLQNTTSELGVSFNVPKKVANPQQGNASFANKNDNASVNRSKVAQPKSIMKNKRTPNGSSPTHSEETIYKDAVPTQFQNRISSSSDDLDIDTSDETINFDFGDLNLMSGPFVAPTRDNRSAEVSGGEARTPPRSMMGSLQRQAQQQNYVTPEERSAQVLTEAEQAKGRMLPTPGKHNFLHTAMVDETYIVVANHVDELTVAKIQQGDYVNFGKLIPRDRVVSHEEQRLELVLRGGKSFYVPVNDAANITSYAKWEQAFRVYSNIYTKVHAHRSCELIEYNHVIHTVAQHYVWDNDYMYNKDFCIHMSRNPNWNWGVILQQVWSLRLRDRLSGTNHTFQNSSFTSPNGGSHREQGQKSNEPCRRYNRGKCMAGTSCRYDHCCSYCFKFGHTILTCRKLLADQERASKYRKDSSSGGQYSGNDRESHSTHNSNHHVSK